MVHQDHAVGADLTEPFWLSARMEGESVVFIGSADSTIQADLLFRPEEILSVRNAAGDISYVEGVDFQIDANIGRILRPASSRMPSVAPHAIAAADGALTHGWTIAVSYTHRHRWQGFIPSPASRELPNTTRRLKSSEPLTICLTGDSISEGYDSSGFHGVPPHQPAFGSLVASGLEQGYGSKIQFHNFGTGGWTSADALWDTDRIVGVKPELVIVAFGMNDASYAEAEEYRANISNLIRQIRAEDAGAEFILVSPMLPTPECDWLVHSRFPEYRNALAELTGDGVALADVTTIWSEIVARKNPHDLSGNGWNHPNDFGHRIYAQTILAILGCPSRDRNVR